MSGRATALETVTGLLALAARQHDLLRTAELPRDDRRTLIRLPATAVRIDGLRVASILRAHLVLESPRLVRPGAGQSARWV